VALRWLCSGFAEAFSSLILLLGEVVSVADFIENTPSQGICLSFMQQTLHTISFSTLFQKGLVMALY